MIDRFKNINYIIPVALIIIFDFLSFLIIYSIFSDIINFHNIFALLPHSYPIEISITTILIIIFYLFGCYKNNRLNEAKFSQKKPAFIIISIYLITLIEVSLISEKVSLYPKLPVKLLFLSIGIIAAVLVTRLLVHLIYTSLLRAKLLKYNVIIVINSTNFHSNLKEVLQYIKSNNFNLTGYCSRTKIENIDLKYLGSYEKINFLIKKHLVNEIVVLNYSDNIKDNEKLLMTINTKNIIIKLISSKSYINTLTKTKDAINEMEVISIHPETSSLLSRFSKRVADIIIAAVGLTVALILYPFIAYKIKKDSPGNVIYKQKRLGRNRKAFTLYKFRTMYNNAEKDGPKLEDQNEDTRITKFGLLLRRSHMDELPQFWNILKGEMSVVGPRPEREHYARLIEKRSPYYNFIYNVKPGLTSLGMLRFGYAHNTDEMVNRLKYDILYINNQSILLDLKITGETLLYIIKRVIYYALGKK
ncbi:exopolysaccharide biosynthesis polyprenyl glycosylphosphotransferase [Marinilabiliaceae bacterium ANBcel2]|nr:exopolysaccharide biosynthesis polyprenyl glycosylphosphotransferase [Marinilabiliaceae bacterium ANBcel2]